MLLLRGVLGVTRRSGNIRGHVKEWRQVGTQVIDTPVVIATDHPVTLPVAVNRSLITLEVKAFTHSTYTMVVPGSDAHNIVRCSTSGAESGYLGSLSDSFTSYVVLTASDSSNCLPLAKIKNEPPDVWAASPLQ